MSPRLPNKYALYERSVQTPKAHIDWIAQLFLSLRGRYPRKLREDFCGTFAQSVEWVKRNRANRSEAIDLDPEPLAYGRRTHLAGLSAEQKRRIRVRRENVLSVRSSGVDLVLVGNFSFFTLKTRGELLRYFKNCRRAVGRDGMVFLEMAGGPGMIEETRDRRRVTDPRAGKFTYLWDQVSFDPITCNALYHIHFKFPDGREMKKAFTYDWRLWSIPEVREALEEAGFRRSLVFWETEHEGEGTGEYLEAGRGDNAYSWIAYLVGLA